MNLEFGKKHAKTKWVFVCHNDISVESNNFYKVLYEKSKDYDLISMCKDNDPGRIGACHISGLLVKNEILQNVDCMPNLPEIDVGDNLTVYCRKNNLNYTSLPNTHNDPSLWEKIKETGLWYSIGKNSGVDRCIVNDEVIFAHLGRGTPKFLNSYFKNGKVSFSGWEKIHRQYLEN